MKILFTFILSTVCGLSTDFFLLTPSLTNPAPIAATLASRASCVMSNLTATNIVGFAGASSSNICVGGVMFKSVTTPDYTNLNNTIGTFTNAAFYITPAHTLTNTLDSQLTIWRGNLLAATNDIKAIYGTQTVIDTGSFTNAFGAWELGMEITRTGASTAHVDAWFSFDQIGPALTAYASSGIRTNWELACVNGVANTNLLQLASNRVGAISNNFMRVFFEPASK